MNTPNTLPNNQSDSPAQCESFHADHITRCQKYYNHKGNHQADVVDKGVIVWTNYNYMEFIEPTADPINPSHYKQGEVECIDAIKSALGKAGFKSFLAGQILKYCWRYEHKNGLEDLKKCQWYLNKLMEEIDGKNI